MNLILQYGLYLGFLVLLAIPLGHYIGKVMNGEKVILSNLLKPLEQMIYKVMKIEASEQMSWKKYATSVLLFSGIGFIFLFVLQLVQGALTGNPQGIANMSWHLSFNNAISFITNTNWQSYTGEAQITYLVQALGLTVQNFVSAATGIAVLFALIRAFINVKSNGLGSFWIDVTRVNLYVLIPISFVITLCLLSQGVVQNLKPAETVQLLEPIAIAEDGTIIDSAQIDVESKEVFVNGELVANAQIVTEQFVPMGPAASQIAIKQLGTNGGGFFGVNSAHPFENPTAFSNLIEMLSILLIPVALCFTFGRNIKDKKQGYAIFSAMFIILMLAMAALAVNEQLGTPQLAQDGMVDLSTEAQAGGNMEGKESRFGIAASTTWTAFTTAASNGSVNSMHDSLTPLGGMVPMLLMQLGEVIFGGVGSGLYGMLSFVILTVFIAGLMVGRTPEYLGKKIEPYEMKWAVLCCLATPIAILVSGGIAALVPSVTNSLNEVGPHGFSELLYAFTSAGANNGSAFAGLAANTPFINLSLGLAMLFARFVPILCTLAIAGSLIQKKKMATTAGTLSTSNGLFIFLLIFVVILVGALSFFPALALGPIAEFMIMVN
ncbi:potassium-transporting ATPase subunit KdpA [Solibacillus sp. R5-41]|uniref:potassium-transporting ATPase subunit KdpA n=1 Tax=Solibacillus sp. R5-41 TaxID=2048654 RepID=UPI000C126205|nr:potassium-transporting ATPase subunit KdpA [Solibacillus sp. R5-41]ATP39914.1 potassium-transporting ATPase subunit KdpA [Solibacillus sp. R5-41]